MDMVKAMMGGRETVELSSEQDVADALAKAEGSALSYVSVRGDGTEGSPTGFIQATAVQDQPGPWMLELGNRGQLQKTYTDVDGVVQAIARWAGFAEGDPTDGHEWTEVKI